MGSGVRVAKAASMGWPMAGGRVYGEFYRNLILEVAHLHEVHDLKG
jgi:hypothetical protein